MGHRFLDPDLGPYLITCPGPQTFLQPHTDEAEYAGLYAAARIATEEHKILANMSHPQPATPLFCDNEVAICIAADTVSQRMSKATDMRLRWIRDRVRQGQFRVVFIRGISNVADFFTKPLAACCPSSRPGSIHRRRPCRRRPYYSFK